MSKGFEVKGMKEEIRNVENAVRDVRNWLAVFKTEYDLPEEAYKKLHDKIEEIGKKVGGIRTTEQGLDKETVKPAANALRDTKNWLATFAQEFDFEEEAVEVLHKNLDKVGQALAKVK